MTFESAINSASISRCSFLYFSMYCSRSASLSTPVNDTAFVAGTPFNKTNLIVMYSNNCFRSPVPIQFRYTPLGHCCYDACPFYYLQRWDDSSVVHARVFHMALDIAETPHPIQKALPPRHCVPSMAEIRTKTESAGLSARQNPHPGSKIYWTVLQVFCC